MKKLYFAVGSQDLYGDECLRQVAEDSRQMAEFLNEKLKDIAEVEPVSYTHLEMSELDLEGLKEAASKISIEDAAARAGK